MAAIEFDGPLALEYTAQVHSTTPYNLTSDYISFHAELPDPLPTGSTFSVLLEEDVDSYILMLVDHFGDLHLQVTRNGVDDEEIITYVPSLMRFWRVRELEGMLYFETSAGSHTWTIQRTVAHLLDITSLGVTLSAIAPSTDTFLYGDGVFGSGVYGGGITYTAAGQFAYVSDVNEPVLVSVPPFTVYARPRAHWIFGVGDWKNTRPDEKLNNANSRSITLNDESPSTASFTFTGPAHEAQRAREHIDDLWVWRDGELIERFRITGVVFSCGPTTYTLEISCTDYRGLLNRYHMDPVLDVEGDVYQVTEGTEIRDAIRTILGKVQGRTAGDLGISVAVDGANWQTGYQIAALEDGQFAETDTAWEAISKLTAGRATFRITPDKVAQLYFPFLEVDNAIVLDWGGALSGYAEQPGVQYANVIRQTGDNVTPNGVIYYPTAGSELAVLRADPRGRIEVFASDTSLKNAGDIKRAAATNIKNMTLSAPTYSLTMAKGKWGGLSHVNLGNVVNISFWPLKHYDQSSVTSITISVDSSDDETVTINAGRRKLEQSAVIKSLQRRMRSIEAINYARPV